MQQDVTQLQGPSYQSCLFPLCSKLFTSWKKTHILCGQTGFSASVKHVEKSLDDALGNETSFHDFCSFEIRPQYKFEKKSLPFFGQNFNTTHRAPSKNSTESPKPLPGELKPQPRMAPSPEDCDFFPPVFLEWRSQAWWGDVFHVVSILHFADFFCSDFFFFWMVSQKKIVSKEIPNYRLHNTPFWGAYSLGWKEGVQSFFFEFLLVQIEQI